MNTPTPREKALAAFNRGIQYIHETNAYDMPWSPDEIKLIRAELALGSEARSIVVAALEYAMRISIEARTPKERLLFDRSQMALSALRAKPQARSEVDLCPICKGDNCPDFKKLGKMHDSSCKQPPSDSNAEPVVYGVFDRHTEQYLYSCARDLAERDIENRKHEFITRPLYAAPVKQPPSDPLLADAIEALRRIVRRGYDHLHDGDGVSKLLARYDQSRVKS